MALTPDEQDELARLHDEMRAMSGQGVFKDTGRRSSGWADVLDSAAYAPVRAYLDAAAKPPAPREAFDYGPAMWNAIKAGYNQFGKDPQTAPTGKQVAQDMGVTNRSFKDLAGVDILGTLAKAKGTTLGEMANLAHAYNPDFSPADAAGLAIDNMGLPLPHGLPGVAGEIKGVKDAGKIADATEAFAERAKVPPSTETRIAQMYGQTGEVRDAVPKLLKRVGEEARVASRQGKPLADVNAEFQDYGTPLQRSAYDNPRNAPPKPMEPVVKPPEQIQDATPVMDEQGGIRRGDQYDAPKRYYKQGENVLRADDMQGPGKGSKPSGPAPEDLAAEGHFWHDENDHSFTDEAKKSLDSLVARGGPENESRVIKTLKKANSAPDNMPYISDPGMYGKKNGMVGVPNFQAQPTGQIGTPGISDYRTNPDPFAWVDDKWGAGKQLLLRHKSIGMPAEIHTSSDLIGKDDYINAIPKGSTVNLYFGPSDPQVLREQYPINPSNQRLELAAKKLEGSGVNVNRVYAEGQNVRPLKAQLGPSGAPPVNVNAIAPQGGRDPQSAGNLSPEEAQELQRLQGEVGHLMPQQAGAPAQKNLRQSLAYLFSPEAKAQAEQAAKERSDQMDLQRKSGTTLFDTDLDQTGDALTGGHLPQVEAALRSVLSGDDYVKVRDAVRARLEAQKALHPANALAGNVTGSVAQMEALPIPPVGKYASKLAEQIPVVSRLAKTIGNAAEGATAAGTMGFIQNPGDTEGKVDPLQLDKRVDNAVEAAKFGGKVGLGAGLAQDATKAVQDFGPTLKSAAEKVGFKSAGAMLRDFRQAGMDQINQIGRFILDKGLVKAGDTYEDIATKAEKLNGQTGEQLDRLYNQAGKAVKTASQDISGGPEGWAKSGLSDEELKRYQNMGFNPARDKAKIMAAAKRDLGNSVDRTKALNALEGYLDEVAERYSGKTVSPRVANDIKTAMDQKIDYARNPLAKDPDVETAFRAARSYLRGKISEHVGFLGKYMDDPAAAQRLRQLNEDYGYSKTVARIAKDRAARVAANNANSLTDRIAGAAGGVLAGTAMAATGDHDAKHTLMAGVGGAALAAGANHLGNKYGLSTLARGLDKAAPLVADFGQAARAIAPSAGTAARIAQGTAEPKIEAAPDVPLKGPERWASDGFDKLIAHASDDKTKAMLTKARGDLMSSPKMKELLIKASDLKVGSAAMDKLLSQIEVTK